MRAVARQTLSRGAVELLLFIAGVSLLLFLDSGRASADTAPGGPPATPVPSATAGSQLTVNRASSTATSTSSNTSSVKRVSTGSTASSPTPSALTPSALTPSTPAPSTPTPATAAHRPATSAAMTSVTAPGVAAPAASPWRNWPRQAASGHVLRRKQLRRSGPSPGHRPWRRRQAPEVPPRPRRSRHACRKQQEGCHPSAHQRPPRAPVRPRPMMPPGRCRGRRRRPPRPAPPATRPLRSRRRRCPPTTGDRNRAIRRCPHRRCCGRCLQSKPFHGPPRRPLRRHMPSSEGC